MTNPMNVGYTILAFAIAVALIIVGILVAGIMDQTTADVYDKVGIPENSTWRTLRSTAVSYTSTGMNIALIGLILVAIGVLLAAVFGFVGVASRGGRPE